MLNEDYEIFYNLSPVEAMALTIWAEARGESHEGQLAVGYVILNRARLWRKSIKEVCYAKNQFSCYNSNDIQYPRLVKIASDFSLALSESKSLPKCYDVAYIITSSPLESIVGDALYYRVLNYPNKWFDKSIKEGKLIKVAEIQNHEFFEERGVV
jgi:hypothetical protein